MLGNIRKKISYKVSELYNIGLDHHEREIVNDVLSSRDFGKTITNISPKTVKQIGLLVPGIDRYSGGITSVLRLGTYLMEFGYDVDYIDITGQSISMLSSNARSNLASYKGDIISLETVNKRIYHVVIATNWHTAYYVNRFAYSYKMYFVQDYEPYFFKLNERYLLAKLTYEHGLHIVSLGKWNIEQIKRECNTSSLLDHVSFPYEPKEYRVDTNRDYTAYLKKKKIKMAVYTKEEGKRIPNILQFLLKQASEEMAKNGIELQVNFFGLKKSYKPVVGNNLGKLNRSQLLELYQNSDFGMVASMTNISLVPYEMITAGLPVIEFKDGSFKTYFKAESAILVDYNYITLVRKLLEAIENPHYISKMIDSAKKELDVLSWKNTAEEFSKILIALTNR